MSFYPQLDNLTLQELILHFQSSPFEGEEYGDIYYQEVVILIGKKGEDGVAFLQGEIEKADTPRLRGILFALTEARLNKPEFRELLLSYLQDERPMIVMEAVDSLRVLGEKDAVDQVFALLQHPSPYVRGGVLRFMRSLYPNQALPLLIEALKDPDFIVRENAADELGELSEVEAIPYLRQLLRDSHPHVVQAAQTAIEILTESEGDKIIC